MRGVNVVGGVREQQLRSARPNQQPSLLSRNDDHDRNDPSLDGDVEQRQVIQALPLAVFAVLDIEIAQVSAETDEQGSVKVSDGSWPWPESESPRCCWCC